MCKGVEDQQMLIPLFYLNMFGGSFIFDLNEKHAWIGLQFARLSKNCPLLTTANAHE